MTGLCFNVFQKSELILRENHVQCTYLLPQTGGPSRPALEHQGRQLKILLYSVTLLLKAAGSGPFAVS